jgi:xylose isomerase
VAADLLERRTLDESREARYAGWAGPLGQGILGGTESLASLEAKVAAGELDPAPVSGRQELLENLVNQRIWAVDGER